MTMNLNYPVALEAADDGGFVVTFPDVPEAITQGEDEDEALLRAVDALETALEMYAGAGEALPVPSKADGGQRLVHPTTQVAIKLAVYQAMQEEGVRKAELARRLGWHMPQVDRLLDFRHAGKLAAAESALSALGRDIHVDVVKIPTAVTRQKRRSRSTQRDEAAV
ncbi:type II toxin-antitoxin system HicB family antitoxin [Algiphilus aromaticivorans]|uniref:type II toxin-antitoxin system HicB family antitoxin n=1 Tax=Algiphilus aromaticivorans TaxID=382454 RepID=UPI000A9CC2BD|nr:type II toxin-antitoxin system HicB family antitoxin [Algiphilus aromaticivorans]